MDVSEVVNKLELIKHNYLINILEKYTEQVAATTPPATTPPATTLPAPTPPATTSPAPTPPAPTPPTPPVPPKPAEEPKKMSEEAVKFENNMMDSLKWVFIGIAIFIVIIIILGVVYWLIFGNGSTTSTSEHVVDENGVNNGINGENGEVINNEQNPYAQDPSYNDTSNIQDPYSDIQSNNNNDSSNSNENNDNSMFSSLISSSSFSRNDPVVESPIVPVVEAPVIPVVEAPVIPIVESPVIPVVEVPVASPIIDNGISSSSSSTTLATPESLATQVNVPVVNAVTPAQVVQR
jgi:hypothetical protein